MHGVTYIYFYLGGKQAAENYLRCHRRVKSMLKMLIYNL
jgi:hypothetical protein